MFEVAGRKRCHLIEEDLHFKNSRVFFSIFICLQFTLKKQKPTFRCFMFFQVTFAKIQIEKQESLALNRKPSSFKWHMYRPTMLKIVGDWGFHAPPPKLSFLLIAFFYTSIINFLRQFCFIFTGSTCVPSFKHVSKKFYACKRPASWSLLILCSKIH